MSECPKVYCPKEEKEVPIWHCLGSVVQHRESCPLLIKVTVYYGKKAEVKCKGEKQK